MTKFFSLLLLSVSLHADVIPFEREKIITSDTIEYTSEEFKMPQCALLNNCYLYIGKVSDALTIYVNAHVLIDHIRGRNYLVPNSMNIPIPNLLLEKNNRIKLIVKDINQNIIGINTNAVKIDSYQSLIFYQFKDWIIRTGVTLFSLYCLLIISFFLFVIYLLTRNREIFWISSYSFFSSIYLLSFSEYLRMFYDPVLLSGALHFPLRLIQDVFLFIIIYNLMGQSRDSKSFKIIITCYLVFIFSFPVAFAIGYREYQIFKSIIYIGAPLVAFPMGAGVYFSLKNLNTSEKRLLLPIFGVLFLMQINDLLVFWNIINGYFFVKIYIPFIVGILLYIVLKRQVVNYRAQMAIIQRADLARKVAHDINSPISVLNMLGSIISIPVEQKNLYLAALNNLKNISNTLLDSTRSTKIEVFAVDELIDQIAKELNLRNDLNIELESTKNIYVRANRTEIYRAIMNFINNSIESFNTQGKLIIKTYLSGRIANIEIIDNGKGIDPIILSKLGKEPISTSKKDRSGNGIGVFSAIESFKNYDGDVKILSKLNFGTTIKITIPTI